MSEKTNGRARGAKKLAEMMTPEERQERAKKAAIARWGVKPPQATHKGNFKEEFGIDVDCYVLNDEQKTAVISQRGMGGALGLSQLSGSSFPRFIKSKNLAPYLGEELTQKLENPLIFQGPSPGGGAPPVDKLYGFDVTILIDVCKAIISAAAEKKMQSNQAGIVRQAHIILNASAKAGIKGLVYALAGYDVTREETIAAFKMYVQEEAREYEREFPEQLYLQWYRLYELPVPERNRPWKFKHLTVSQVYTPLAKSNGKIHELLVAQRTASGQRSKKLHEFLAEIGVKALRTHLGQLLGIAQVSKSKEEYENHVNNVFGEQPTFDF